MGIAILKHEFNAAMFTWITEDDSVKVSLRSEQMPIPQHGEMTKDAARLLWANLISSGYKLE